MVAGAQRAAVAVVLARGPEPAILFVKRAARAGDPWSGQMALPGGHQSPSDGSLADTAERETYEETGLDLARSGERLGALDDVRPLSVYLPLIVVSPYVFGVSSRVDVAAGEEIERALWLPVAELFSPAKRRPYEFRYPARGTVTMDSIVVDGYTIWGLTERVLGQVGQLAGV